MALAPRSWLSAVGLAAITGARTAMGPALVARGASRRVRTIAYGLAALELIGDKLPFTPSRTAWPGLVSRILCGAGVARSVARRQGRGRGVAGAAMVIGAAAAIATAFTGVRLRLALTRRLGGGAVANAVAGGLEDAALIAVGTRLATR